MNTKSILITGGNAGIGKAIAVELAKQKHHVVIVSRNAAKGSAVLEEIKAAAKNNTADLIIGDLSGIQSTKELAKNIIKKFPDISICINNAGVWPTKLEINADGLEMAFMVNHMAPFILCHMLLPQLMKNRPARIVNVNAALYPFGKVHLEKTPYGKDFGMTSTYINSKLCNIFFTQKFSELIQNGGVTVNAVHPGVIRTNLGIYPGVLGTIIKIYKVFLKSPKSGAKPPVWLATSPEVASIDGKYFELCKLKPYTKNAVDPELRDKIWDLSLNLASL
jgi:NAD(P)-dependent dehydrogenase (short-subunit alcohol dehydrogenase family)